jgi:5-methylcytosine-specific restriction endonuclease McrA
MSRRTFDSEGITCGKCKQHLPFDRFYRSSQSLSGYKSECKSCRKPGGSRESSAKWRAKNRDAFRLMQKAWRENNREHQAVLTKAWAEKNKEQKASHTRNYRARKRAAFGRHGKKDLDFLLAAQCGKCAVCKIDLNGVFDVDHIIPLISGGGNDLRNLQLTCSPCNKKKNRKHPVTFMQENGYLL